MRKVLVWYQYNDTDDRLLDTLFSGIFRLEVLADEKQERERIENAAQFRARFENNIFYNEHSILYELAIMRKLTTGAWPIMEAVIEENRGIILSAQQVRLSQYGDGDYTDSDKFDSFLSTTKAVYERICNLPFPGAEGFRTAVHAFIETFENKYGRACLSYACNMLTSLDTYVDDRGGRRRVYQGYTGACDFWAAEKQKIDALRGAQRSRQFVVDSEFLLGELDPDLQAERAKRTELLCKLGIHEIDNVWSGIRRTRFIGIVGPPKGGKTSLAAFMVHRLLQAGRRVCVWAMEGSARESWINKLICAYCDDVFGFVVSTKDLEDNCIGLSDERRRMVGVARVALAQDERLSFIEETGYVEDFLEVIDGHYRVYNQFDAIVVDSLLNLQTKTGRKKTEYLSSAYITLKDYIEHKAGDGTPPVCIATAQFKQEAIKEARTSAEISFDETSGGETAETIRTPDEVIGIFGTPAQKEVNTTTLYHIATRHTMQFPNDQVMARFGAALFASIPKQ
jgi:hypothetical protein